MPLYREELKREFIDKEYREAYADDFLNTKIAMQIRVIREQRGLTQKELAELIGTKQPGVARLEDVNYASWNISTLKKIASALKVRLNVSFETFGSLLDEDDNFSKEWLQRPDFEQDPAFRIEVVSANVPASALELVRDTAHIITARRITSDKPTTTGAQPKLWPLLAYSDNREEQTTAEQPLSVDVPEVSNANILTFKIPA